MNDATNTIKGHCRCGQVKFEVNSAPMMTFACHCTGCQQMSSSAFSLSTLFADASFTVTSGDPVIGGLHGATRHYFCNHCMSWLFTRPEGMDDLVNIRASLLEDFQSYTPFIETYTDEKLKWATTGAKYSFSKFPPEEQIPALLEEFGVQH